ncbi:MAG: hypothetical protein ACPIOQ_12365, partial [Promethearchaeia archaeon]
MMADLKLAGNKIGPQGAAWLAPVLARSSSLTRLDLNSNHIGAE